MISAVLAWLQAHQPGPWVYPAMSATAFVETLFPPFPGDVLFVLLSGWAAGPAGWAGRVALPAACGFAGCFSASILLILAGTRIGRSRIRAFLASRAGEARLGKAERLVERHAAPILAASRFLPGIRSLLVVVAGYSGVGAGRAMLFGGASALLWYVLMAVAGMELGYNLTALENLMRRYETVVWIAAAAALAVWAAGRFRGGRGAGR